MSWWRGDAYREIGYGLRMSGSRGIDQERGWRFVHFEIWKFGWLENADRERLIACGTASADRVAYVNIKCRDA